MTTVQVSAPFDSFAAPRRYTKNWRVNCPSFISAKTQFCMRLVLTPTLACSKPSWHRRMRSFRTNWIMLRSLMEFGCARRRSCDTSTEIWKVSFRDFQIYNFCLSPCFIWVWQLLTHSSYFFQVFGICFSVLPNRWCFTPPAIDAQFFLIMISVSDTFDAQFSHDWSKFSYGQRTQVARGKSQKLNM